MIQADVDSSSSSDSDSDTAPVKAEFCLHSRRHKHYLFAVTQILQETSTLYLFRTTTVSQPKGREARREFYTTPTCSCAIVGGTMLNPQPRACQPNARTSLGGALEHVPRSSNEGYQLLVFLSVPPPQPRLPCMRRHLSCESFQPPTRSSSKSACQKRCWTTVSGTFRMCMAWKACRDSVGAPADGKVDALLGVVVMVPGIWSDGDDQDVGFPCQCGGRRGSCRQ